MRLKSLLVLIATAVLAGLFVGCEWEMSGDDDTWDMSGGWVNFSGVYRAGDGGLLIRLGFETVQSFGFTWLGAGDGARRTFSTSLTPTVVPGSVTVSDGFESFTDGGSGGGSTGTVSTTTGTGVLVGDQGGSGSVNYQTGAITVTFNTEPGLDVGIWCSYLFERRPDGGSIGDSVQGSTLPIFAFTVTQIGDQITITDDNGNSYDGRISVLQTSGGGGGTTSGTAVGQFEAWGTSGGLAVRIVGTFQGAFTAPTATEDAGVLVNRTLDGTWIETGGMSGSINATAPNI